MYLTHTHTHAHTDNVAVGEPVSLDILHQFVSLAFREVSQIHGGLSEDMEVAYVGVGEVVA